MSDWLHRLLPELPVTGSAENHAKGQLHRRWGQNADSSEQRKWLITLDLRIQNPRERAGFRGLTAAGSERHLAAGENRRGVQRLPGCRASSES